MFFCADEHKSRRASLHNVDEKQKDTQKNRFLETFPCCSLHQSPIEVHNTLLCFALQAKTVKNHVPSFFSSCRCIK
jgi:hypothetical protein